MIIIFNQTPSNHFSFKRKHDFEQGNLFYFFGNSIFGQKTTYPAKKKKTSLERNQCDKTKTQFSLSDAGFVLGDCVARRSRIYRKNCAQRTFAAAMVEGIILLTSLGRPCPVKNYYFGPATIAFVFSSLHIFPDNGQSDIKCLFCAYRCAAITKRTHTERRASTVAIRQNLDGN